MRSRLLMICLAAVMLPPLSAALCRAQSSSDQRFLDGLRQRRLFQLAERYCSSRLEDPQLPDPRRAELVIELSLSLADWALNAPPDEREPLWSRALEVTEAYARQNPQSGQLLWVRFQGALGVLARGELSRQESEVVADGSGLREQARTSLVAAIRSLSTLSEDLEQELRERSLPGRGDPRPAGQDQPPVDRLLSLRDNLQYQLARAYRNQAQCYEPQSPDWTNSLTLAVKLLDPLARFDPLHPLTWRSRIDEVVCYRLLDDDPIARQKLDALSAEDPPPEIALRAKAERLRLALTAGRVSEAAPLLSDGREIDGVTSADLDYALLETCLAAWRAAGESGDEQQAAQWQAKANEIVRLIQRSHGPYWTRRAQMLLSSSIQTLPGNDLEMWVQAAENSYHSGQYDQALANYDRAGDLAQQQGNEAEAFRLGFVAATIEHRREQHEEAISRYRRLAMAMPNDPRAPEAHVLALYHAGRIVTEQANGSLDQYVAIADEHLRTWPNASTTDEVRWCLGRTREYQGDWQKAVEQYQAISTQYPKFDQVVEATGACYQAWLDQCKRAGQPAAQIASAAAAWFESLLPGPEGRLPERWSSLAGPAAISAARFRLSGAPPDFDRAEQILSAALGDAADASAEWRFTAMALLVFSLAGQGRHDEAARLLEQVATAPPEQLLELLQGLARVAATADPDVQAKLAGLQLAAVELLHPRREALSPSAQRDFDRITAEALAEAGRTDEALEVYRWLSTTYPRDGEIQEGYARLLLTRQDRPSLETALVKWREVEEKSRPGADRWFRAKYSIAWLQYRLGNRQQAEKIIQLLQVLHPEMGGAEMKARFLELLEECRR